MGEMPQVQGLFSLRYSSVVQKSPIAILKTTRIQILARSRCLQSTTSGNDPLPCIQQEGCGIESSPRSLEESWCTDSFTQVHCYSREEWGGIALSLQVSLVTNCPAPAPLLNSRKCCLLLLCCVIVGSGVGQCPLHQVSPPAGIH